MTADGYWMTPRAHKYLMDRGVVEPEALAAVLKPWNNYNPVPDGVQELIDSGVLLLLHPRLGISDDGDRRVLVCHSHIRGPSWKILDDCNIHPKTT